VHEDQPHYVDAVDPPQHIPTSDAGFDFSSQGFMSMPVSDPPPPPSYSSASQESHTVYQPPEPSHVYTEDPHAAAAAAAVQSPSDSVSRLANKFAGSSISGPSVTGSPSTDGKSKKWVVDTSKGSSGYVPGAYTPVGMPGPNPSTGSLAKKPVAFDPAHVDTSSANVSEVRTLWQQKAKNAPPPMPKVKAGGLAVATESVSTVHTVGLIDRSAFAKIRTGGPLTSSGGRPPAPAAMQRETSDKSDHGGDYEPSWAHKSHDGKGASAPAGVHHDPKPSVPAHPQSPTSGHQDKPVQQQQPQHQPKATPAPPQMDFNIDQFKELMDQIEGGDADQKAYAAMELQTLALDSRSQVLMAQNGAISPLVRLLQPGDPMVQASAAGALWNLAANEQNKFAIAQAGAIQPLVAMLYSDVREAQLSAAGALQNLCVNPSNKKTVAAAGGIEALMMLLSDKDRHVKAKAAGALQSLAVDEDNQRRIKSLGAIPLITKLLSSRTPEVQSNAAGALHNLAVNDDDAQEAVAAAGAIPPLINLMQNASPDLQAKAAATIWSIAGREENRRMIMELGGIPPLIRMVQSNHTDCQAKASGAIRCLTMSTFTRPEFEKGGVIPHLVALLQTGNQEITINAAGALENMGCR